MGWDNKVSIIAENCKGHHVDIAHLIQQKDSWEIPFVRFKQLENNSTLFFSYERRKYLPYWIIQEISTLYEKVFFTVVADCPDFIGGPAGLVKILNGQIIDSYGFWGDRQKITINRNPEILLKWFGKNGVEENIRQKYFAANPMTWCNDNYHACIIDFTESELSELDKLIVSEKEKKEELNWIELRL